MLNKYAEETASPAEQEELKDLLEEPVYAELAKDRLLLLLEQTTPLAQHSEERWQNLLKRMNSQTGYIPKNQDPANIGRPISGRSDNGRRPAILRLLTNNKFWWGAAAVLMLVYANFYFTRPKREPIANRPVQSPALDPKPGGNTAILTLSDGSTIALDSARNGIVAQQGNTKIAKLSNGQLAYNTLNEKPSTVLYNTLSTPRGGQYKLALPDGSFVWLNAASSIRYPTAFSGKERLVSIRGEAYFEIAKNPSMPFRVILPYPAVDRRGEGGMDSGSIEVLGTHFNVNAYEDEKIVKATLLEGSIRLISQATNRKLEPGQQGQLNKEGQLSVIPNADTEAAVAWKNGR
ncbi:MAG: FecR domain-containing protein, partial [Bacteroidota bacterium]